MYRFLILSALWIISCVSAYFYGVGNKPKPEIKEVVKIENKKERVTQIVEVPGQKVTIIKEVETQTTNSNKELSPTKKDQYVLSVSRSLVDDKYSAQVGKKVFGDLYLGAYSNMGSDYGLTIGITF